MTPDERREVVAMLRADARDAAHRANGWNQSGWMETAWRLAARANLLTAAADELEKNDETP